MPLVVKDRVRETSTTTNTGTFTLNGAVSNFQSFSVIGDGNTTYYTITLDSAGEWEVGIGTYTASGTTLSRDVVLESSNGGTLVNFSAGTKNVFCTYPAERSVYSNEANTTVTIPSLTTGGNVNFTGTGNRITGDFSNAAIANRVAFQTSTTNGNTNLTVLPNGTSTTGGYQAFNNSDPTNASLVALQALTGDARINSTLTGTGTYLPMTFYTGGSERMRVDTSGNVGINTTSPDIKLDVVGGTTSGAVDDALLLQGGVAGVAGSGAALYLSGGGGVARAVEIAGVNVGGANNAHAMVFSTSAGSAAPVERMRIDSAGNVGIGTSSPIWEVEVKNTGDTYIGITAVSSGAGADDDAGLVLQSAETGETGVYFRREDGATTESVIYRDGTSNDLRFDVNSVLQMRLNSNGDLQFNSGYGSVATAYGCRAWVNFNGDANSNLTGTYARTSPSTTVTVTITAHGLKTGDEVFLDFTTGTGVDGAYTATVTGLNTFTVTTVASTTTSGNVTLRRNTIRASGNVSSISDNSAGEYSVNFAVAMPDANYAVTGTAQRTPGLTDAAVVATDGQTAAAFKFVIEDVDAGAVDPPVVAIVVHR